jgi:hypothetical protein
MNTDYPGHRSDAPNYPHGRAASGAAVLDRGGPVRKRLSRSVAVLCALTIGLASAGAGAQVVLNRLQLSGSPARAGDVITAASTGCDDPSARVFVALMDSPVPDAPQGRLQPESHGELASAVVTSDPDRGWSAQLRVPPETRPGRYPVTARCVGYTGYDGLPVDPGYTGGDGYSGVGELEPEIDAPGAGLFYADEWAIVLPPGERPPLDGPLTLKPDVVAPGGTVNVTGSGWGPGEQVTVILYSSPVVLSTVETDDAGRIGVDVRLPAGTEPGEHVVVAMNATSFDRPPLTLGAQVRVQVDTPPATSPGTAPTQVAGTTQTGGPGLAYTGLGILGLLALGLALFGTGAYARHRSRRSEH